MADMISHEVFRDVMPGVKKRTLTEALDNIVLHPVLGYVTAIMVIGGCWSGCFS